MINQWIPLSIITTNSTLSLITDSTFVQFLIDQSFGDFVLFWKFLIPVKFLSKTCYIYELHKIIIKLTQLITCQVKLYF